VIGDWGLEAGNPSPVTRHPSPLTPNPDPLSIIKF